MHYSKWSLCAATLVLYFFFHANVSVAAATSCKGDVTSMGCQKSLDPGISSVPSHGYRHIGNPADVIYGAKQQRETDFKTLGSPLHFSRYYHSGLSDVQTSLGHGWRHSYMVKLYVAGEQNRKIIQADGSWLEFIETEAVEGENTRRFAAARSRDGYIVEGETSTWYLPNGKSLTFHGSYLTSIDYQNGEHLRLFYHKQQLQSVTDHQNRSIQFEYAQNDTDLPSYEKLISGERAGRLIAMVLPDGERVEMSYSRGGNLSAVDYSKYESKEYRYENPDYPNHLTRLDDVYGEDKSRVAWTYDQQGRVARIDTHDTGRSLYLSYEADALDETEGTTFVKHSTGRTERYFWHTDSVSGSKVVQRVVIQDCVSCKSFERFAAPHMDNKTKQELLNDADGKTEAADTKSKETSKATSDSNEKTANESERIGLPTRDDFVPIEQSLSMSMSLPAGDKTHDFVVEFNRLGTVIDIRVGSLSFDTLRDQYHAGMYEVCGPEPVLHRSTLTKQAELACLEDIFYLKHLAEYINSLGASVGAASVAGENDLSPDWSAGGIGGWTGGRPEESCLVNPFEDCDEIERNLELAQLSKCAYDSARTACGENWERVSPAELGLSDEDFEDGSFAAAIYKNKQTGEYVLAFRGTDDLKDWGDNALQSRGMATKQYRLAVELAKKVRNALPNENLTITGHSLGGGLATAAALAIGAEATVFNPAALHPKTAKKLGLDYNDAKKLVDVTTMDGDALAMIQAPAHQEGKIIKNKRAPGDHTLLPAPDSEWLDKNTPVILGKKREELEGIALHSLEAIMHTQHKLLTELCDTQPPRSFATVELMSAG